MSDFQKRILKFRIWDKGEFQHIELPNVLWVDEMSQPCPSESAVFQQFAGLKDKNGNDIYEGDFVKYHLTSNEFVGKIVFDHFSWQVVESSGSFPLTTGLEYEIIGNIFENPYLSK